MNAAKEFMLRMLISDLIDCQEKNLSAVLKDFMFSTRTEDLEDRDRFMAILAHDLAQAVWQCGWEREECEAVAQAFGFLLEDDNDTLLGWKLIDSDVYDVKLAA